MKIYYQLLLGLSAFVLVSCSDKQIIGQDKFIDIYSEVLLAQSVSNSDPETTAKILEKVCKDFNVTLEQYKSTVDFYKSDYEGWELFFEKVVTLLEKKKLKASS